jgi:hypothetical protein
MTRAAVLLTAILAAASVGVFAQDSPKSASAPPQDGNQITQTQNSTPQPGAQRSSSGANDAQPASSSARQAKPGPGGDNTGVSGRGAASEDGVPAQQLPQTSTILPLLGLIGLGSLVAGLFARR